MRTRAAGLRGAKLRPAEAFSRPKFKISCGIKGQARSRSLLPGVRCRARSVRTGSPQPLPGGGLQLASCRSARASPSARLRVCLTSRGDAVRHRRAAFTDALCCIFDLEEVGGPQPPPGGGPQLASRRSASSVPSAGCAPKTLFVAACVVSSSVAQRPAARSRPRAEGCILALLESRPVRSAAGRLRGVVPAKKNAQSSAPVKRSAILRPCRKREKTAPPEGEAVRIAVVRDGAYSTSLLYCVSSSGMVHFQSFVPGSFGPTVTAKLMPNTPPCPSR